MFLFQTLVVQIITLVSAGLWTAGFSHHSTSVAKAHSLSRYPLIILLGFSPWLTPNTPIELDLFLGIAWGMLFQYYYLLLASKEMSLKNGPIVLVLPIVFLILLIVQPDYFNFYYDSNLFLLLVAGLGALSLFYFKRHFLSGRLFWYQLLALASLCLLQMHSDENFYYFSFSVALLVEIFGAFYAMKTFRSNYFEIVEFKNNYEVEFEKNVEMEVKKRTFYMELTKERMAELNRTDHLTKLLNRKTTLSEIEHFILDKNVSMFCLFVFDIDHFKLINDRLGHATGDHCLKNIAAVVKSKLSEQDFAGRYGGDEFIIVLKNRNFKDGLLFAEALYEAVRVQNNPPFNISMGMSVYPWDGESYKKLFEVADKGLYDAKEHGRGRLGYKGYIKQHEFNNSDK